MPTTSARLLSLLSLLQARRDWPGQLLADRLDVSARTVRRDVDRLRELGYPIAAVKGPDGGYRLDAGSELPPLLFDDEQAVALAIALQLAATSVGSGVAEAAARALTTVRQVMPARLRRRIDTITVSALDRRRSRPTQEVSGDALAALSDAVHAHELVRFEYRNPGLVKTDDFAPVRRVEPHQLITSAGRWYLVAWDVDRSDWRLFRVDRIALRTPTGPRFTPRPIPGGDVHDFVLRRFRGSRSIDRAEWPCRGAVVLDLPAVDVLPYAGDAVVEDVGPGRCRVVLGAWSWIGLAASFGRFDAELQVLGPDELKAAFADLARRYAAASSDVGRE